DITQKLEIKGIKVYYSHEAKNVEKCDAVVYSAAIHETNPELAHARELGIPLIYRADYLGYIMSKYTHRIGISGMHGKSTATSMTAHIFLAANADPTVVSGAIMKELEGGTYRIGNNKYFIMEACEYCDSFLSFTPNIAVVLNVEMDHPDYFKDIEQIKNSFEKYVSIANNGYAVVNWDDENVREAVKNYRGKTVKFGITGDGLDYKAENISYKGASPVFDIIRNGEYFITAELSVTGEHNIMNALASVCSADLCGIDAESIKKGLKKYKGASRRMEYKGQLDGKANIYEDYAHHPTEVRATLSGVKKFATGDIWCVFQPHTFTRTFSLFDEFTKCFDGVKTIFADIYAAREVNISGVSSKDLAEKVKDSIYLESFEKIAEYLKEQVKNGDIIIIMGAGDINKVCALLEEK
ncbi:MAG: UDP-N-acetylmuramate--L-alanine ligase, partial [Clostridia bacterium]|nr:UDP-N-acetylmuramate--L-alanine ligase [Clostridia bacterium]